MKFSTLLTTDYTWTAATLLDKAGIAITAGSLNVLYIINGSASNRVFRINGGAPFQVPTGATITLDAFAGGCGEQGLRVEMDSATFTNIVIFGK